MTYRPVKWSRLPATWDELFAYSLGKPDPLRGYGIAPASHQHMEVSRG